MCVLQSSIIVSGFLPGGSPVLLLYSSEWGHMVVGGSAVGNDNDDGPVLVEKRRREGGTGRNRKNSDVEDVDIEADRERLALPSYPPLDGDGVRVGDE